LPSAEYERPERLRTQDESRSRLCSGDCVFRGAECELRFENRPIRQREGSDPAFGQEINGDNYLVEPPPGALETSVLVDVIRDRVEIF
jgi:hypothetical protein